MYSIVVPTYNSETFIHTTLKEILNIFRDEPKLQFELLVINDGSTDNTRLIVDSINGVKQIVLNENYGQDVATNIGVLLASFSIVITFDDDLKYNPKSIRILIDNFNSSKKNTICYGYIKDHKLTRCLRKTADALVIKHFATSYRIFNKAFISPEILKKYQLESMFEKDKTIYRKYIQLEEYIKTPSRTTLLKRVQFLIYLFVAFPYSLRLPLLFFTIFLSILFYQNQVVLVLLCLVFFSLILLSILGVILNPFRKFNKALQEVQDIKPTKIDKCYKL